MMTTVATGKQPESSEKYDQSESCAFHGHRSFLRAAVRCESAALRRRRRGGTDRPRCKRRIRTANAGIVDLPVVPEDVFRSERLYRPDVARKVRVAGGSAVSTGKLLSDVDAVSAHRITRRSAVVERAQAVVVDPELDDTGPAAGVLDDHEVVVNSGTIGAAEQVQVERARRHRSRIGPEVDLARSVDCDDPGFDPAHAESVCVAAGGVFVDEPDLVV